MSDGHDARWFQEYAENQDILKPLTDAEWKELAIVLDAERAKAEKLRAILVECEQTFGCECPYCDRDFGEDFGSHAEGCKIGEVLREGAEGGE